ncbi:ABC transporter ATP-binding protein [Paenibacillus sanfengchensis]|uniref:ABC transporter ATP-binding protein n=1 Tax=Paenibacillus TaxID=44249 RepID=UPI003A5BB204
MSNEQRSLSASAMPEKSEPPAIEIIGVSFTYPGSDQPVLNAATLSVEPGSFTAIIGGNGCGKSTLCKLFNGLIPHYYSGDFEGEVKVGGVPSQGQSVAELSRKVGYVYQDFENQLVRPTVLDEACFAPLNYGLPDYRERALRALNLCGLTPLSSRFIWELSGGQKHLLALAGALALEPDILVVDEPVSQLDPRHARQVYEVLRRLNRAHGKTVVVIEHHTEFIADYCRDVCLMEQGRVLWKLPVAEALNRLDDLERLGIQPPEATQTAARLAALRGEAAAQRARYPVTTGEALRHFGGLLEGRAGEADERSRATGAIGTISAIDATDAISASPAAREPLGEPAPEPHPPAAVIRLSQAALNYRTLRKAEHAVLRGLTLDIAEGERVALVGNNGAGKSSLLRLIAGIARPSGGSVEVLGLDTHSTSVEELSKHVAFVFQNPEDMFIEDSLRKEVAYCLKKRGYPEAGATVKTMLRSFRLEELQDRDARLLSGGQQRRVSLAIGAAIRPAVMLLDEPTANLDLATREELLGTLRELERHVRTVLIATHDMQLVSSWATRVIVLHEGLVAADGTAAEVFADPELIRRAGLALTQSMELSAGLALQPPCATPQELAARLHRILAEKEAHPHGARPQLV